MSVALFFLVGLLCVLPARAQSVSQIQPFVTSIGGRLTVRPREAATATKTAQSGEHSLKSLPGYLVYVPTSCVGHRCPLYVYLDGGERDSRVALDQQRPVADKYGMILLAPNATAGPGHWALLERFFAQVNAGTLKNAPPFTTPRDTIDTRQLDGDTKKLDSALKIVLHTYAIDPTKIALAGMSLGGAYTLFLGQANRDIFSRVVLLSPTVYIDEWGLRNSETQFLFAAGLAEPDYVLPMERAAVEHLRAEGNSVKHVLVLRPHENRAEDFDYVGRWLTDSWRTPAQGVKLPALSSIPALTDGTFSKWTTFWSSFLTEPDSIQVTGRQAHQREFNIPVQGQRMAVMLMDMPAFAAKFSAVAADLSKAGITAQEEQAYRLAVISASAAMRVEDGSASLASLPASRDSTRTANVAFLRAHINAIDDRVWITP